jgi:hypothetical protein
MLLQVSIRPFFRVFVPQAIMHDLHIAIVTFSKRVIEIETTISRVFGVDNAEKIVVRGDDSRWLYVGTGNRTGKQMHMASAGT